MDFCVIFYGVCLNISDGRYASQNKDWCGK